MKRLKKSLIVSLMSITVLAMSGVVAVSDTGAASNGDLVKIEGSPAVYYLADSKRHVFPNESTYFSWYSDFNGIQIIAQSELEGFSRGANVTMRPGTRLVTSPDESMVYAVEPGGVLRSIVSETNAIALYGADWAANVVDIIPAFMSNYTDGDPLVEGAYPAGTLVKESGQADVYYLDADGTARKFADAAAFESNRFQWGDIVEAGTDYTLPTAGDSLTATEGLGDTSQGGGAGTGDIIDPLVGSGLSVALASDTPSAGNIPQNASTEFLKINLTAANDGDVSINTIVLKAYDLGDATKIDNVTIYDSGVKVGTSKNMNSDRIATFNFSSLTIEAGTTKSLTVKAKIDSDGGNYAIGIDSVSSITTNGATVSGSFPIVGNTKAPVSSVTTGSAILSINDATGANAEFGEDDVILVDIDIATEEEPILFESARFRNGGDSVVSNLKMIIDGAEVATAEMDGDYVTFDLNNYLIDKGDTITVEIYGDISGSSVGANDTLKFYVNDENDLIMTGQDYGYGVTPTIAVLDSKTEAKLITIITGDVAIDVDKSAITGTPTSDIENNKDNVELATFSILSSGSDATINRIVTDTGSFAIEITGAGANKAVSTLIENVKLVNGGYWDVTIVNETATTSVGGAVTVELDLNEEISLLMGVEKIYQLTVDVSDTVIEDTTFMAVIENGAFDIETADGDAISDIIGGGNAAVMTVKEADLDWTTTALTAKSLVTGAESIVVYKARLESGDVSDIKINSITISDASSTNDVFEDNQISTLYLYIDGTEVTSKSGDIVEDANAANYIKFNTLNYTLVAGATVDLELKADFSSNFTNTGSFALTLADESDIDAKDEDNDTVSDILENEDSESRTVTLATEGDLKVELKIDDKKANDNTLLLAGSSVTSNDNYIGELEITTQNEPVKVKTLVLEQKGSAADTDVKLVKLYYEDGSPVSNGSKAPDSNGDVNFSSLDLTVGADKTVSLFIGVEAKSINAEGDNEGTASSSATVQFALASDSVLSGLSLSNDAAVTAQGVDSGVDIDMVKNPAGDVDFGEYSATTTVTKTTTIVGSLLTAIENMMETTGITGGTNVIAKYQFVFDNGSNRDTGNAELKADFTSLVLTTASSSDVSLASIELYDVEDESTTATGVVSGNDITFDLSGLDTVDGSITLEVKAVITTAGEDGDYLETKIDDLAAGDLVFDGGHAISDPLLSKNSITGGKLD